MEAEQRAAIHRLRIADERVDLARKAYERACGRRADLVREARQSKCSWAAIAQVLGVSVTRVKQIAASTGT